MPARMVVPSADEYWHRFDPPADAERHPAAVLVPLVNRPDGIHVLLTQRTSHLDNHAGQISFPGGRVEDRDADRVDTALRETEEEIGLPRTHVDVIGQLPEHEMHNGFQITPVVGWVDPPFPVRLDAFEVADIFEVPLAHFLDPANHQRRRMTRDGLERRYLAIPYRGRFIWGATAGMLFSLYVHLRD
jgi:8-oxo-dGTP pyrophosphatase MutT (NUDIX family)